MLKVNLLCLANSRKLSGRCIAGLRVDGGGWLRPVASTEDGTLFTNNFRLGKNDEPEVLDLLAVPISVPRPGPHHPEDHVLGKGKWQLLERPALDTLLELLDEHLDRGPRLLRNASDRIHIISCVNRPLDASLCLVEPDELEWSIKRNPRTGKRQTRAKFRLRNTRYDLSVTDPVWESRLRALDFGTHPLDACGLDSIDRLFLTISLGEPYKGYCYKLVASVIALSSD